MSRGRKTIGFLSVAALAAFGSLVVVLFDGAGRRHPADKPRQIRSTTSPKDVRKSDVRRTPIRPGLAQDSGLKAKKDKGKKSDLDDAEVEKLLGKVVNDLLAELSKAAARGDADAVLKLVDKLRKIGYGAVAGSPAGARIASLVKQKILEAAGALGPEAVDVATEFLKDSDLAVKTRARDLVFDSLRDGTIGDRRRAEIITVAAEEMTDSFSLTWMFQQISGRMRNSVRVEAVRQIESTGTPEAKAKLPWVISAMTGDPTITTTAQLPEWLEANPDDDLAEWYFGPKSIKGGK